MKKIIFLLLVFYNFQACNSSDTKPTSTEGFAVQIGDKKNQFDDYWYQGKAEITSYELQQARYGELHKGDAVMVFVTEDFSKSKKVKLDYPGRNKKDAVPVLKLNATRKFNTGVYPYSMMTSSFTPVDLKKYPFSLKVTGTSQEWCGHTYMQLKEAKNHFDMELRSYFESEGEANEKIEKAFLEDEIWARIRIEPQQLPTGPIKMLPGLMFSRLRHIDYQAMPAKASLQSHQDDAKLLTYEIVYEGIERKLSIHFNKKFPYEIEGWETTMQSGFGAGTKTLSTVATKKKMILSDYWSRHGNTDLSLRKELGLPLY